MYIPFISAKRRRFERRKGGGGGKSSSGSSGGKSSSGSSGGSGGKSSGGSSPSKGSSSGVKPYPVPVKGSSASGKSSASVYGYGGDIWIQASLLVETYWLWHWPELETWDRTYGSGYPGITGRGVAGHGFPFWFWPIVWGGAAVGVESYLDGSEYGDSFNTSRFGGSLMEVTFISNNSNPNTTFHILSDNSTVTSLLDTVSSNCSSHLSSSSSTSPFPFNASSPSAPQPNKWSNTTARVVSCSPSTATTILPRSATRACLTRHYRRILM
ncbi:hypothetical protein V8B97DRAFT_1600899 [Scleroderma yunnanense]